MRLGLLGGTFDPPHLGHLAMARVAHGWGLDRVLLIPTAESPHKPAAQVASAHQRYAMTELATLREEGLYADPRELTRGGVSWTIDTLVDLKTEDTDHELFLILGQDNWRRIASWKDIGLFGRLTRFLVFGREEEGAPHEVPPDLEPLAIHFPEFGMPYASRDLRRLIGEGDDRWRAQVPPLVADYIVKLGLYR